MPELREPPIMQRKNPVKLKIKWNETLKWIKSGSRVLVMPKTRETLFLQLKLYSTKKHINYIKRDIEIRVAKTLENNTFVLKEFSRITLNRFTMPIAAPILT